MDRLCGMHRSAFVEEKGVKVTCEVLKQTDLFVSNDDWKTSFTRILILMLQLVMITLIRLKCRNFEASTADQNGGRMVMMREWITCVKK